MVEYLKEYCVIGLGNIEDFKKEIKFLSETNVNYVSGEGLIIATFKSTMSIFDIDDFLKVSGRSFIVFEMNIGFFSANLQNEKFQKKLFGSDVEKSNFVETELLEKLKKEIYKKSDEELLKDAIEQEDYEKAALLRDKINSKKIKNDE